MDELFLPGLPLELIRQCYAAAPGNEMESGKFASKESSAALVANAFGLFLGDGAGQLPPLPAGTSDDWPPLSVHLEAQLRFPWRGGLHPWLDVLIETPARLIGIESKRYEPFRPKGPAVFSEAYDRPVWGDSMSRYTAVRRGITDGSISFARLDAAQLVKHAYGLRTAVHRKDGRSDKRPVLFYLHAEPAAWPDERPVSATDIATHRAEVAQFAALVEGDEVGFHSCTYRQLLDRWQASPDTTVRMHAMAVHARFAL